MCGVQDKQDNADDDSDEDAWLGAAGGGPGCAGGRLVISAGNRTKKVAPQPAPAIAKPSPATAGPSPDSATAGRVADAITTTNLKWEPGAKDDSTISFDLAWNNSGRADRDSSSGRHACR